MRASQWDGVETVVTAAAPRRLRGAAGVFVDLLDRHLAGASLILEMDGETVLCGARGERGGPLPGAVRLRIHDRRFFSRVLGDGNLGMNAPALDSGRYDGVFRRMWEYYFQCGIAGAFASDGAVYQVLFARDYAADMPLRRV